MWPLERCGSAMAFFGRQGSGSELLFHIPKAAYLIALEVVGIDQLAGRTRYSKIVEIIGGVGPPGGCVDRQLNIREAAEAWDLKDRCSVNEPVQSPRIDCNDEFVPSLRPYNP